MLYKSTKGILVPYKVLNGTGNMTCDEEFLNNSIKKNSAMPVLRFYGWNPACVSIGRNQSDSCINKDYCTKSGIDIVKRVTGGRALLHENELTYSFVCPESFLLNGDSVIQSYKEISSALISGFKKLGINADFPIQKKISAKFEYCMMLSTGADLCFEGKKLVGSAQFRKKGYILQHGSILFNYDKEKIKNIFSEEPLDDKIICLNEINPQIDISKLCNSLKQGFEEHFNIMFENINQ